MSNPQSIIRPFRDAGLRALVEKGLKPILIQLEWAVSHDTQPDSFTKHVTASASKLKQLYGALRAATEAK